MLTDYHVHLRPDEPGTTFARYFTGDNVARYRAAATERGIAELGVSEHVHRFRQALDVWTHPYWEQEARDDLDEYCDFVRGATDLRLGIEVDYIPGCESGLAQLIGDRPWDYVIGSVHFLGGDSVDQLQWDVWRRQADPDKVWQCYFETLAAAARSGLYDIMAHPDLVKVWGRDKPAPTGDKRRFYELAVEAFVEAGVAVEVSTAGLRKHVGEIYPAPDFLQMVIEAGCPLALSSDAHRPEQIGYGYDDALALLATVGVEKLSVFHQRKRMPAPLGAE